MIQTPEQQHYLSKLLGYHYDIQYRSGNTNTAADALSRSLPAEAVLQSLTVPHFVFLAELKRELAGDSDFLSLSSKVAADPSSFPAFRLIDGLLYRHGRIWLSPSCKFRSLLLREFHETVIGGHAGVIKTLKRLSENFFWPNMRKEVQEFVAQCGVCQKTKYSTLRPAGLLQPLPTPSNVWEDISMDFVTSLPGSHGLTVILVVVDRFSKGIHLGALPTSFTATKVADLFINMVCKLHGFPKSIVLDRDPVFVSRFWSDLFKLSGTLLRMSSAYHPQTDGQTEVTNRTIEQYLRAFVHDQPSHWVRYLPWAEYHYNTSVHTSSGLTPYQVIYGKPPPSIPSYVLHSSSVEACDSLLSTRDEIIATLRHNLSKAQKRMKAIADSHRRELEIDVGAWVYVKLQPYRQVSLTGAKYHKLSKRFYRPYRVMSKVGLVAYKLELPSHSKIHDVFHCSLLKPHIGAPPTAIDHLPPATMDNHPIVTPLAILSSKWVQDAGVRRRKVLVQWAGLSPDDTSWEDWDSLCTLYDLEDKVELDGVGIVTYKSNNRSANNADHIQDGPIASETRARPKRSTTIPIHMKDYQLYK